MCIDSGSLRHLPDVQPRTHVVSSPRSRALLARKLRQSSPRSRSLVAAIHRRSNPRSWAIVAAKLRQSIPWPSILVVRSCNASAGMPAVAGSLQVWRRSFNTSLQQPAAVGTRLLAANNSPASPCVIPLDCRIAQDTVLTGVCSYCTIPPVRCLHRGRGAEVLLCC